MYDWLLVNECLVVGENEASPWHEYYLINIYLILTVGSRIAETDTVEKDFKFPLSLGKDTLYYYCKKEIKIWEAFTTLPEEKTAPAICMALKEKSKEAILNIVINELIDKSAAENLIACLDQMYLKVLRHMKQMKNLWGHIMTT